MSEDTPPERRSRFWHLVQNKLEEYRKQAREENGVEAVSAAVNVEPAANTYTDPEADHDNDPLFVPLDPHDENAAAQAKQPDVGHADTQENPAPVGRIGPSFESGSTFSTSQHKYPPSSETNMDARGSSPPNPGEYPLTISSPIPNRPLPSRNHLSSDYGTASSSLSGPPNDYPIGSGKKGNSLGEKGKNPLSESLPSCTCSISSECALAARNGVRDCRKNLAPVYDRTPKTKPSQSLPRKFVSTKERARIKRSNDDALYVLTLIKKIGSATPAEGAKIFDNIRNRLHKLQFFEIGPESQPLIPKFLDQQSGLPAIVESDTLPWDIKLDADMLRLRWQRGDFDRDLMRGLVVRRTETAKETGVTSAGVSRRLDPSYRFKESSSFVGEGNLRNGQWFPFQIAAVRDGAHGEMEAGISGYDGVATSIILNSSASKRSYADIDEGSTVSYCGTRGKDGNMSHDTSLLVEAAKKQTPIRLLRGSKLGNINPYRPAAGLRYDGLYQIVGQEILEQESMLYRFRLQRLSGQPPIRHKGKEARPTADEKEELKMLQSELAASRPSLSNKRKRL